MATAVDWKVRIGAAMTPVAAIAAAAAATIPRATPFVLLLLVMSLVVLPLLAEQARLRWPASPLAWLTILFGLYLALNATWSVDPADAAGKVLFYGVAVSGLLAAAITLPHVPNGIAGDVARGIVIGVLAGALILMVEAVFDQPLKRLLSNLVPLLRPSRKHIQVSDGQVTHIGLYVLNRGFGVLMLLLWPALLLAQVLQPPRRARLLTGAIFTLAAIGIFASEHETSVIALALSLFVFLGLRHLPHLMRPLVVGGWVVATLLVVPLALGSYAAGLHHNKLIPETGRNRIILWNVTSTKIWQAPLLGVGVASTRELDDASRSTSVKPADHSYPLRTGRHAHNIFLQTWYELGAVGALFLLAIGLCVLRAIDATNAAARPYAYSAFVAAVTIGAFTWGMWQVWFMAAFALGALVLMLALELSARRSSGVGAPRSGS